MISCEPNDGRARQAKFDTETGIGIVDFGSDGVIIYNSGTIVVKRDSTYILTNGNVYHTMAVRVYYTDKKQNSSNNHCCVNDTTKH